MLIAGAVFAFVSMVAVISETNLPGSASPVSTPAHGNLTIGAGEDIVSGHADGSSVTALGTALAFPHPPGTVSAPPTAVERRMVGSRGAPAGSSGATGSMNGGANAGPPHGGPTPVNPGRGRQPSGAWRRPLQPGPRSGGTYGGPARPGGEARQPPPGLAKKPGGLPPGLAKKPGGLPPGLAKKPGGLPPGHARR